MKRILDMIDDVRRAGGAVSDDGRLYRAEVGAAHTLITYCSVSDAELARTVANEVSRARRTGRALEWDVFGHDPGERLPEVLLASGFIPEPKERVLTAFTTPEGLSRCEAVHYEIRQVDDAHGVEDLAEVSRDIGRENVGEEARRLLATLRDHPDTLRAYVAYVDGAPVACARLHFADTQPIAWLAGGRTKTAHRKRGLYTALVRRRFEDALARGCVALVVDALPTSEPILVKRGFRPISDKQAFVLPNTPA